MGSRAGRTIRACFFFAALGACGIVEPDIEGIGTVEFRDIEGGCWDLSTAEGFVHPMNLPEEFRVDGLEVLYEADYRNDIVGFCARIVELKRIERL